MNPKQQTSYPDKPKKAQKPSQGYPVTQNSYKPDKKKPKPRYPSKRYPPDPADQGYYAPYKRKPEKSVTYIYKQDLIQKGFHVYGALKPDKIIENLCENFPECFTDKHRKVIIDA